MLRGDLIEVYKMFTLKDRVDKDKLFPLVEGSRTRGHNLKIRAKTFRRDIRILLTESGGGLELFSSNSGGCWFNY